jgi:DNA gyrase/topoisomerase IV subunit B
MAENKKLYKEDSIESLSPLEFTRLRPGVYAGDTTYSTQLLVEILSNAIDEFNLGHGNLIEIGTVEELINKANAKNFENAFVSIVTGGKL